MSAKQLSLIAGALIAWVASGADASLKVSPPATVIPDKTTAGSTNSAPVARTFVKEWKVDELVPVVNKALKGKRNFETGKRLFTELSCVVCHHFGQDGGGGVGPDLTGASSTFSVHDLLENIIEPSKEISSLYITTNVQKKDGDIVTGWIPEETDTTVSVMEDMFAASKLTVIERKDIARMSPSKLSLMPVGLLNTLKEEEISDLVAFLFSGGDSNQKMFK